MLGSKTMLETLRALIAREIVLNRPFENDEDLILIGLLDSISALKLVAALEKEFDRKIPSSDLTYENFCSVDAIATYLDAHSS